jgi:pimeloyl-ACP methyl ester carboxylesterase
MTLTFFVASEVVRLSVTLLGWSMRYMGQERTSTIMDSAMGKSLQSFWDQVLTICTRTLIGAYLTQMFPDRVGKVILDGVLDAYSYTTDFPWPGFLTTFRMQSPLFEVGALHVQPLLSVYHLLSVMTLQGGSWELSTVF